MRNFNDLGKEWWKKPNGLKNLNEWWSGPAEEDIKYAVGNTGEERTPEVFSMLAIAKALVEIRDELRIMNERSNDNGKT